MAATEGVSNCAFRLAERLSEEAELYRSIVFSLDGVPVQVRL